MSALLRFSNEWSLSPSPAADCTVEAVDPASPLKMETDGELNSEESTKPVLLTDLTLTGASSVSDTLPKKLPRKRLNLGPLRANRPPFFGDACKAFDPAISSPLPTSKRSTTTDSELYTPEPHQKSTQVIFSNNIDSYQGWIHVPADPTSLPSSGEEGLAKSADRFTKLDEANQRHLVTPDPEQLTTAPNFLRWHR